MIKEEEVEMGGDPLPSDGRDDQGNDGVKNR